MLRRIITRALATMLAVSGTGCATWETLTFSPDENSNKTKNQIAQLYYVGRSSAASADKANTDRANQLREVMPDDSKSTLDRCAGEEAKAEAAPLLLLLAPVAAKYVFDQGADALAGYAADLQNRGSRGYSASLILSGEDANTIISTNAQHNPGCFVLLRGERDGKTVKPGMITIIRPALRDNIIRFEPVYVRFDDAMALTERGESGAGGRIDALYAISASVARPATPGVYPKQVVLGVGEFSLAGVQLGTSKPALKCGSRDEPCLVQTKSIDRPDSNSTSVEVAIAVREIGTQVNDAKRAEAEIKAIKEAVGPKVQEYVGGVVAKLNAPKE